jgi:hypothetical protein
MKVVQGQSRRNFDKAVDGTKEEVFDSKFTQIQPAQINNFICIYFLASSKWMRKVWYLLK